MPGYIFGLSHSVRNENLDQNKFHLGVSLSGMIGTRYDIPHIARNRPFCQLQWEVKSNWSITNCALLMFLTPSFMKCYQTCQEMDILQVITSGPPKKQMSQFCRDPRRTPFVLLVVFSKLVKQSMDTKKTLRVLFQTS